MATRLQTDDVRAHRRTGLSRLTGGGTTGNELLTAGTAVILLALLAALGLTILRMHSLLAEHMFIGIMLLGPVALKMALDRLPLRPLLHRRRRATGARDRP